MIFLHLSNPVMVATISFLLPIPEIIMGIQRELSKMSCITSKTINITVKKSDCTVFKYSGNKLPSRRLFRSLIQGD